LEGSLKNIWVPLSGQIAQNRKVETIANNVANINTPGFKKDEVVFREYLAAMDKGIEDVDLPNKEWKPEDFYHTYGSQNSQVKVDGSYTDLSQGQLVPTKNPMDLALNGKGFFEVLTPNGIRFTRNGSFTISRDGELVTENGFKLLSATNQVPNTQGGVASASPLSRVVKVPSSNFVVSPDGNVYVNNEPKAQISVVEFKDPHALRKEGNNLFINNKSDNFVGDEVKTAVVQGFVEQSNVNAVGEMSELIKAHRHFESIQKAMNAYDNISGRAVNDISRF
jgi:flagellar basal-body rod protein FlgF